MFVEDREQDDGSPINFSTPLASSPPIRNRDFREPGESSRRAQGNNQIMEMLSSIHKRMEENEREWNLQQGRTPAGELKERRLKTASPSKDSKQSSSWEATHIDFCFFI